MQPRGVDFIGIAVSDIQAAKAFYGGVLGLSPAGAFGEHWAEYDAGNVTLSLIEADADAIAKRLAAGPEAAIGVAIAVEDVQAAVDELRAKGVPITVGATEFPPCYMATVRDPSGNWVWLHQRKDGAEAYRGTWQEGLWWTSRCATSCSREASGCRSRRRAAALRSS